MKTNRKTIQIGLLALGFFLIILTYFIYPRAIIEKVEEKKAIEMEEEIQEDTSFTNVEYKGITKNGSPYTVKSEFANINKENEDLVHMTNITATYYYEGGGTVTITSDEGLFNKNNGDINFRKNVKMIDQENNILTSDNLDMIASEEYAKAYNNVEIFTYDGQTIVADQIKVDAVENTLKVSMFNDEEKIKLKLIE